MAIYGLNFHLNCILGEKTRKFSLQGISSCVLDEMFIKVYKFQDLFLALTNTCLRTCTLMACLRTALQK